VVGVAITAGLVAGATGTAGAGEVIGGTGEAGVDDDCEFGVASEPEGAEVRSSLFIINL